MLECSVAHVFASRCPNFKVKMLTKHASIFATSFVHSFHSESCMIDQSVLWTEFVLNLFFESTLLYCYQSLIDFGSSYQLWIYLDFIRFLSSDSSFDLYLLLIKHLTLCYELFVVPVILSSFSKS